MKSTDRSLGGSSIVHRSVLGAQGAADRLLAGLVALALPLLLSTWLLRMEIVPVAVDDRIRLTLVTTPDLHGLQVRQPTDPAAADAPQASDGNRPAQAPAGQTLSRPLSARLEPKALKLGVPEVSLHFVASTTQRNIAGTSQASALEVQPKFKLSLKDSSFMGRWAEAQRTSVCADLLMQLRSAQGGPSTDVILASLRNHGCKS